MKTASEYWDEELMEPCECDGNIVATVDICLTCRERVLADIITDARAAGRREAFEEVIGWTKNDDFVNDASKFGRAGAGFVASGIREAAEKELATPADEGEKA